MEWNDASTAPPTVVIEGLAGVGKTRLLAEYFHRYGPSLYRDGLFWLNADVSPDDLEKQHHGILKAFILPPDVLKKDGADVRAELGKKFDMLRPEQRVRLSQPVEISLREQGARCLAHDLS